MMYELVSRENMTVTGGDEFSQKSKSPYNLALSTPDRV